VHGVVTRGILLPFMRSWGANVLRGLTYFPRPYDDPRTHASGVDSDRILLFGGGPAVGWGVSSHDLGLPGTLARAVSAITERGADVDVVSDPGLTAAGATGALAAVHLDRYDAVVVTLGLIESVQLGSLRAWRRHIDALLDQLQTGLPGTAHVFLLGIHTVTRMTRYDRFIAAVADQHRGDLNQILADVAQHRDRVTYIPFDPPRNDRVSRDASANEYRDAATLIAGYLAPVLEGELRSREAQQVALDEQTRQRAVDSLDILDTPPEQRFDRIVEFAQRAFNARFAALTIIDRDRQWQKSAAGMERGEVARDYSICATTITLPGELIVPDTLADDRFPQPPSEDGDPPVRFYAGYPIEAPEGQRIGALCVLDTEPRDESTVDRALLRDLALMVQREVWRRDSRPG
jgi:hypothetical protein